MNEIYAMANITKFNAIENQLNHLLINKLNDSDKMTDGQTEVDRLTD